MAKFHDPLMMAVSKLAGREMSTESWRFWKRNVFNTRS